MKQFKLDKNNSIDGWDLYSTILFPEDRGMRDILYNLKNTEELIDTLKATNQPAAALTLPQLELLFALSKITDFEKLQKTARIQGEIAGLVLLFVFYLTQGDHPEPSLKKAIFLCEKHLTDKKTSDNKKYPISKQSIRDAWNASESVAHIWAAFLFFIHTDIFDKDTDMIAHEFIFGRLQIKTLSFAKTFLDFGTNYISARNKTCITLIDKNNSWTTPSDLILEEIPVKLISSSNFVTEAIKKYRA